jgi:hypothetical protein
MFILENGLKVAGSGVKYGDKAAARGFSLLEVLAKPGADFDDK